MIEFNKEYQQNFFYWNVLKLLSYVLRVLNAVLGIHFILIRFIWIRIWIRILDLSYIKTGSNSSSSWIFLLISFTKKMSRIFTCFENFIIYYFNNFEVFGFWYFILQICVLIAISCFFDVLLIEWGFNGSWSRELNCWSMDPDLALKCLMFLVSIA